MPSPRTNGRDDGFCSLNLLKYILFTYTFFFWIISLCLLGISIWVFVTYLPYLNLLSNNTFLITTCLMIAIGTLITFVSSLGGIAIWKEDRNLIKIYIYLLIIIFIGQCFSGLLAYTYQFKVHNDITSVLYPSFIKIYNHDSKISKTIDLLQQKYKCCGAFSYEDWQNSTWLKQENENITRNKVPDSCCKSQSINCGVRDHPSNIYYDGCLEKLVKKIKEHLVIISSVGIGFCGVQILGIIFSISLVMKLRRFKGFKGLYGMY